MKYLDKINNYFNKRKINKNLLLLIMKFKLIEKENSKIINMKLKLIKNFKFENEQIKFIELYNICINKQKFFLKFISEFSNDLNKNINDNNNYYNIDSINDLLKPIIISISKSKILIENIIENLNNQNIESNSNKEINLKLYNLKQLLHQELSYYEEYKKIKTQIPRSSLANIEIELNDNFGKICNNHEKYILQNKYQFLLGNIIIYILFFLISDKETKQYLSNIEPFALSSFMSIASSEIYLNLKKILFQLKK